MIMKMLGGLKHFKFVKGGSRKSMMSLGALKFISHNNHTFFQIHFKFIIHSLNINLIFKFYLKI